LFKDVWNARHERLVDLNNGMLKLCLRLLKWQKDVVQTDIPADIDLGNLISTKKPFSERTFYQPFPYRQNFGNGFVPNLSILDLLLCHGPESSQILAKSVKTPLERFIS
jgi:hypothetical protein